jgi:hypothetical protein
MGNDAWRVVLALTVVMVAVEGVVIIGLARQIGTLLLQVAPARAGAVGGGPKIGLKVDAEPFVVGSSGAVILFVAPNCGPCATLLTGIGAAIRNFPELAMQAAIVGPDTAERERYTEELVVPPNPQLDHLFTSWEVPGTPFAVGIDAHGVVADAGVVNNLPQFEALCVRTAGHTAASASPVATIDHPAEVPV